jgi:hypothetical protein
MTLSMRAQTPAPGFVPIHQSTAYEYLNSYKLFSPPQDTFAIPTDKKNLRWFAFKGDTAYFWNVGLQKWEINVGTGNRNIYTVTPLHALNDSTIYIQQAGPDDSGYLSKEGYDSLLHAIRQTLVTNNGAGQDSILGINGLGDTSVIYVNDVAINDGWIVPPHVQYSGTPNVYDVSAGRFRKNGHTYDVAATSLLIDTADATQFRWARFVADTSGHSAYLPGALGADETAVFPPDFDPAFQILITDFLIHPAGDGGVQIDTTFIYKNNAEWTFTSAAPGTFDANNTIAGTVYEGTKSINATNISNGGIAKLTNGSPVDLSGKSSINFYLKLKAAMPANGNLALRFYNGTTPVSGYVNIVTNKSNTTTWQPVGANISQFGLSTNIITGVWLIYIASNSNVYSGYYADYMYLQNGISNLPPIIPVTSVASYNTNQDTIRYTTADGINHIFRYKPHIDTTDITGFSSKVRSLFSAGIDMIYNNGVYSADTTNGTTKLATQGDITRQLADTSAAIRSSLATTLGLQTVITNNPALTTNNTITTSNDLKFIGDGNNFGGSTLQIKSYNHSIGNGTNSYFAQMSITPGENGGIGMSRNDSVVFNSKGQVNIAQGKVRILSQQYDNTGIESYIDVYNNGAGSGGITMSPYNGNLFAVGLTSGASTDSIVTYDAASGQIRMRDAAAIGGGGGGSPFLPVTGTGTATGDITGDLDGHLLSIEQDGIEFLSANPTPNNESATLQAYNTTDADNSARITAHTTDTRADFDLLANFDDLTKFGRIQITANASASTITYTADTHTFNGNVIISNLATSGSAPSTSGTRQQMISDGSGQLSFIDKTFHTLTYGASITKDMFTGYDDSLHLTGDAAITFSNEQSGDEYILIVTNNSPGGHEITIATNIVPINPGADSVTVVGCKFDGTNWHCASSYGGGSGTSTLAGATDANISSPADANILLYKTSNSKWNNVAVTGDVTISNTGATAIGASKVTNSMLAGSIAASKLVGSDIATVGTIGTGTWQGTVVAGLYGGTGVANSGKTITLGGNLTTSGAFNTTLAVSGSNTVTFPNASITVARSDAAQTFTGVQTFSSPPVIGSITNTGTLTLPTVTGTVMQYSSATISSSSTGSPSGDAKVNEYYITALAANITFSAPSGSLTKGNIVRMYIVDAGVAKTITWNGVYKSSPDRPAPNTTIAGKGMELDWLCYDGTNFILTNYTNNYP